MPDPLDRATTEDILALRDSLRGGLGRVEEVKIPGDPFEEAIAEAFAQPDPRWIIVPQHLEMTYLLAEYRHERDQASIIPKHKRGRSKTVAHA